MDIAAGDYYVIYLQSAAVYILGIFGRLNLQSVAEDAI